MKLLHPILLATLLLVASCGDRETCPRPGRGDHCSSECSDGLVCVEGTCRLPCSLANECPEGLGCRKGSCRNCLQNDDCRAGEQCDESGRCLVAAKDLGNPCTEDKECLTGFCADGVCCETECSEGCRTCAGENPGRCERDWSSSCHVTYPEDVSSIQDAIDLVEDGGLVTITEDRNENIVLDTDKALTIEGAGDPAPVITAGDGETAIHIQRAAAVTIRNLQISGGSRGILVSAPIPLLLDKIMVRHAQWGVAIDHGDQWRPEALARLQDCDLFNNTVVGLVVHSAPVEITGTRLHNNRRALRVENSHSFRAEDSIVSQSFGAFGSTFLSSDDITLERCIFWNNAGVSALLLTGVRNVTIAQSRFNDNSAVAILVSDSSSLDLIDIQAKKQFDGYSHSFLFEKSLEGVDLGDLDATAFLDLPGFEYVPEHEPDFGDNSWQGNGIEINDSQLVVIDRPSLAANEGSGILIRHSDRIAVNEGSIILNERNGVTAQDSTNVMVHRTTVGINRGSGIAIYDGSSFVDFCEISTNVQNSEGGWGVGLSLDGGRHHADDNYIYYNSLAGIAMLGGAELWFTGNEIHESPIAVAQNQGSNPHAGDNSVTCTTFDPCIDWVEFSTDPEPAPPPRLPLDPTTDE